MTGTEMRALQREIDQAVREKLGPNHHLHRWDGIYKNGQRPSTHPPLLVIGRDGTIREATA